jgi:hypothetical protein
MRFVRGVLAGGPLLHLARLNGSRFSSAQTGMRQQRSMGMMFRQHYGSFIDNTYHPAVVSERHPRLFRVHVGYDPLRVPAHSMTVS